MNVSNKTNNTIPNTTINDTPIGEVDKLCNAAEEVLSMCTYLFSIYLYMTIIIYLYRKIHSQ